jgi:hypothetical protein
MTPQQHLKNLLESSSYYELTKHDNDFLIKNNIKEFIKSKLLSKKFRKWKPSDEAISRLEKAVDIAIKTNSPVKIIYPQGGYKLWRLPSSPEVDWAEFFNIAYVLKYISPILKTYAPGVELIYYMHTLVPERHDNLTTEEINSYVDSFQKLIDHFLQHSSKNLRIVISKDADFYESREEYFEELESHLENGKAKFNTKDEAAKKISLTTSKLNLKIDGFEDLSNLNEDELNERILKGAYYEQAISFLSKPTPFTKADDKVLIFSISAGEFIGIGTTKASITKFWVGYGVLAQKGDSFREIILSPKQFDTVKSENYKSEQINLIDLKNFKEVRIFESLPNFSNK